jgi:hypothetical protein
MMRNKRGDIFGRGDNFWYHRGQQNCPATQKLPQEPEQARKRETRNQKTDLPRKVYLAIQLRNIPSLLFARPGTHSHFALETPRRGAVRFPPFTKYQDLENMTKKRSS